MLIIFRDSTCLRPKAALIEVMLPESHEINSASGAFSRKVWWLPATDATKLCIFLDAEYYLEKMNAADCLLELQVAKSIPSVNCLFVSNVNAASRQEDYVCNREYSQFIAEDVVAWARACAPRLSVDDHAVCGLSLSGLAAAFLTLTRPLLFPRALCQSGSFWWNNEWLLHQLPVLISQPARFWLSVGDKERQSDILHVKLFQGVPQIDAVDRIARALTERECTVNYHLFQGGHDIPPWKEELPQALSWLLR